MNAESMPLKHEHQQYADHLAVAADAAAAAPCRTTKTTIVTRAFVVVCGVAAVVAGVTYLSTGLYHRYPVVTNHRVSSPSGVAGGVVRKGSTTTITLAAFMKQYPELKNLSHEQRAFQYKYYLLHMNGMSVDDLDAYYHTHDDGQQEGGGGGAGATNAFSCCKDKRDSSGCWTKSPPSEGENSECLDKTTPHQKYECEFAGWGYEITGNRRNCCRTFPNNRVGSKLWVWEPCI